MLKIAFVVYRDWGYEICKNILAFQKKRKDFLLDTLIIPSSTEFRISPIIKKQIKIYSIDPVNTSGIYTILKENNINIVCLYSWSWIVKKPIITDFICLCLHPSPLPRYRGGTPIQHQITNGEKKSAVSIFKMSEGIDNGPIYNQSAISFLGNVHNIFARMVDVGTVMTEQLIEDALNNELVFTPQTNIDKYPPNKRRTPSQSEIKKDQLIKITYTEIYNLVRGLLDPYPNAFISLGKKKLFIQEISKSKVLPKNAILLEEVNFSEKSIRRKKLFVKLKDGFARIVLYKIL